MKCEMDALYGKQILGDMGIQELKSKVILELIYIVYFVDSQLSP